MLLSGIGKTLGPEAESLLFAAARDDHVHEVIKPALEQASWVVCDRFTDSTRVYQGELGKVDPKLIRAMERVTIGDHKPDLTIILDVPVAVGLERARQRRGAAAPDRFESETLRFTRSCARPTGASRRTTRSAARWWMPMPIRTRWRRGSGPRCATTCFSAAVRREDAKA